MENTNPEGEVKAARTAAYEVYGSPVTTGARSLFTSPLNHRGYNPYILMLPLTDEEAEAFLQSLPPESPANPSERVYWCRRATALRDTLKRRAKTAGGTDERLFFLHHALRYEQSRVRWGC